MKLLRPLLALSLVVALAAPAKAQDRIYAPRGGDGYRGGGSHGHGLPGGGWIPGLLLGAAAAAAAAHERDRDPPPHRHPPRHPPDVAEAEGPPPRHRVHRRHPVAAIVEPETPPPRRHRTPRARVVEPAAAPRPPQRSARALLPAPDEKRLAPDEILVAFKTEDNANQGQDFARAQKLAYVQARPLKLIGVTVHRLRLPQGANLRGALRRAGRDPRVVWAQPNYYYQLQQSATPATPGQSLTSTQSPAPLPAPAPEGYAGAALNLAEAHKLARGQGVAVAVIDSQVDAAHPELAGVATENFDSLGGSGASFRAEAHAHGTAMAGAISGHVKLAGSAPAARLLAVRAFDPKDGSARGATLSIVAGLDWAAEKGARIVNMSFAGPADPLMEKMVGAASASGMALIAAAGNEGPKAPPQYPGAYAAVIAVAAVDEKARIYARANRGDYIKLAAPGVDVLAAAPHGGYDLSTGTSIACAEVSGIAALILEKNPGLDLAALRGILRDSARKISGEGDLGEADAAAALQGKP